MEENSEVHMETDVSSTTDDVPETHQVTEYHGDVEMVIVVEKIKDEEDDFIDSKFEQPESQNASSPTTTAEPSPQKDRSPQKIIVTTPVKEYSASKSLLKSPKQGTINMDSVVIVPSKPNTEIEQPVSVDSSTKTETIVISPAKTTDTHCIKISKIQVNKSPFKQIKLVRKRPIGVPNAPQVMSSLQDKPSIKVVTQDTSTKGDVKDSTEVSLQREPNTMTEKHTSPNKNGNVQEKPIPEVVQIQSLSKDQKIQDTILNAEKQLEASTDNDNTLQNNTTTETEAQDTINTSSKDADKISSDNSSMNTTKDIEIVNTANVPEIDIDASKTLIVNTDQVNVDEPKGPDSEKMIVEEPTTEIESIKATKDQDKAEITIENTNKESLNESQNTSDIPEKEHNKSISRELKSLINSAKESKIISECTQLTSKTRKSRSALESPNLSLTEGDNSQLSDSSEKSERLPLKRSMRSQNPEFVNKCKQFLSSVTSKVKEADEAMSEDEPEKKEKPQSTEKSDTVPPVPKKKKSEQAVKDKSENVGKLRRDSYCWRCHWTVEQEENDKTHPPLHCTVCPRSYHYKCLSLNERKTSETTKNWVCPDCLLILSAESSESRSPAMKKISLGMLCVLLKHALDRMMELQGAEPFIHPVDRNTFPDYDKYIVHPMDLTQMKQNIEDGHYGSTEAFVADVQWILHNSIIFNTCEQAFLQSKLTGGARALVRSCKAEMGGIEACPECYAAAHAHKPTWFTDVCTTPHILLWAKLKGFPYWPAKGMTVNSSGLVDVRFFGAHDRAWVPAKDCYLFSEKDPNNFRSKRQDILDSMLEAEQHIRNISRKYGKFVYPPFKTQFEPSQMSEQLKIMIPTLDGDVPMKDKSVPSSPVVKDKDKKASSAKSSSSANEGDASKAEEKRTSTNTRAEPKGDEENNTDKGKLMEADKSPSSQVETIPTRKRRRSNLEEAVLTIINNSNTKGTPEKKKKVDNNTEQKKAEPQQANNKSENTATTKKESTDSSKKKTDTPKSKSKDEEPSSSTLEDKESQRVTPIKLVALPRTNKQTPKMFTTTKITPKPITPTSEQTPQKVKSSRSAKTPSSEKVKEEKTKVQNLKRRTSRSSKSASDTPKTTKQAEKKIESSNESASSKEVKNKETKQKDAKEGEGDKSDAGNASKSVDTPKSAKDRLHFDDDTSLAVIARKTRNSSGMPTISNVCSLSTSAQASSTTDTPTTTSAKTIEITIEANSVSSIFTPTSSDNVRNMQDAVTKLQKLRENEPRVGRVGVKAFARMTSPERNDNVQVEVKAEPIDLDEADADRQNEKMDLMNACKLRPVNQTQSLRDVRINRVIVGPSCVVKKNSKPESRPRAKKSFPQPRRADEGRSELNGKNSMVYIPIQPPVTPVPIRAARPTHTVVRPTAPNAGNKVVNTVTTPLKPTTSTITSPSILPPLPTVSTPGQTGIPTVGQVPTAVHTVPLMTSVNGQWMLSLQPVMSVGGVDSTSSPSIVNGLPERGTTPASLPIVNATPTTPAQAKKTNADTNTPSELSRLQQRPALGNPLDPNSPVGILPTPSTAGPLTTKLNQNAVKLADFFRSLMEDTIERLDDPLAAATSFRMQLEQAKWRHSQEVNEIKHNHELSIAEMRLSFEKEKQRAVQEARRVGQVEMEAALKVAKSKQWCANCLQEAQFYCCWNTAYCDLRCQRTHWPQHFATCAQVNKNGEDNNTTPPESRLQSDNLPALQKSAPSQVPTLTVGDKFSARLVPTSDATHHPNKASIIVSMMEDNSGNQTMKCVGTYKPGQSQPNQMPPLILNKQVITDETGKKVVTSGGYLIVGATSNSSSIVTPASTRRSQIQYFT